MAFDYDKWLASWERGERERQAKQRQKASRHNTRYTRNWYQRAKAENRESYQRRLATARARYKPAEPKPLPEWKRVIAERAAARKASR